MKKTWFSAALAANDPAAAEIAIYDVIGMWGISAGDFRDELAALGDVKTINLRVSSPGGDPFVAYAVGAMMQRHPAKVVATIDGVAASAATLITSFADEVQAPANAMLMVHDPASVMFGAFKAADLQNELQSLKAISASMSTVYQAKTGKTAEEIAPWLAGDTWMTAEEAKAAGLVDVILPARQAQAKLDLSSLPNAPAAALALVAEPVELNDENAAEEGEAEAAEETETAEAEEGTETVEEEANDNAPDPVQEALQAVAQRNREIAAACALRDRHDMIIQYQDSGQPLADIMRSCRHCRAAVPRPTILPPAKSIPGTTPRNEAPPSIGTRSLRGLIRRLRRTADKHTRNRPVPSPASAGLFLCPPPS